MLGVREPIFTEKKIMLPCVKRWRTKRKIRIQADIRQSNHEGQLVDWIQEAGFDNRNQPRRLYPLQQSNPDAQRPWVCLPEVHISDIHKREDFRKHSVTAPACIGQISGKGIYGYVLGIRMLYDHING